MLDPSPADILILGGTVLPMNDAMEIIEDGGLAIKGDSILAVGASDSIRASFSAPKTIGACARGSDVCTVIINGRVVMEERELTTIDEAEAVRSVRDLAASID
jgi:5-methylthioadenosine/S-adenosylhomocysteine deaminase